MARYVREESAVETMSRPRRDGDPTPSPSGTPPAPGSTQRVPVLLVAGSGRSGSTLLSRILAGVEGAFFGGEIRYVFQRGLIDDRLCGCNVAFRQCPLWGSVLEEAYGGAEAVDARAVIHAGQRLLRARHLPRTLLSRRSAAARGVEIYVEHLDRLYQAIQKVTGGRFVVDSSKLPAYGRVLDALDSVDLYVVHLVRDPRAAAWSWRREKAAPDRAGGKMEQRSALKSAALWSVWNGTAEALWGRHPERYLRLRYEDFLAEPRASVRSIMEMMGMADVTLPFVDDRTVALGVDHSVAGNPDRLSSGVVALRASGDWFSELPARDRIVVSMLTGPLLVRYGYPLRSSPVERPDDAARSSEAR